MKGKLQPSLCQSLPQIAFQIEAMTRLAQHARTVYLQLAALLRQLHRRLRLSQYVLQFLLLMARQRAANGAIDADLKIGEAARGGKGAVDALDNLQRVGKAIVKPCENPEFIAAKAAQYVALTKAGLQPPRNGDDQFVARDGAKRFIDATETDEINRKYRILRSEEHTSELKSLMRISYAVFCVKKNTKAQQ